jgi:hypothetical protein
LSNVTFTTNTAVYGGGVYCSVSPTSGALAMTISGSTFNGNKANLGSPPAAPGDANPYIVTTTYTGGGLYVTTNASGSGSVQLSVSNSTFYQNVSNYFGGGIALRLNNNGTGSVKAILTSLTVYKNQATQAGGGLYISLNGNDPCYVQPDNNIIAGNTINTDSSNGPDVFGIVSETGGGGFNLIGDGTGSEGWGSNDYVGTTAKPFSAGLDPNGLASNGGPTQTIKLLTTSQWAYRTGDPNLIGKQDQRGLTRRVYVSKGAYDPDAS